MREKICTVKRSCGSKRRPKVMTTIGRTHPTSGTRHTTNFFPQKKEAFAHENSFHINDIEENLNDIISNNSRPDSLTEAVHTFIIGVACGLLNNEDNIEHNILQSNITQEYNVKFDVEGEIRLPSLNVRGFYDVVSRDCSAEKTVKLYDIKTTASFSFARKFSRKLITPQENRNHYLQLGTYGLGLREEGLDVDQMSIIYYNKDNSTMREVVVPNMFIDEAKRYWYSINEEHSKGLPGFNFGTSPANAWICGYCQFKSRCNPPPKF